MMRVVLRLGLAGFLLSLCLSVTLAQDAADDFRKLFRKPETAVEYFNAITFELDVGKPDLAAKYLRGLILKKPEDKELLALVDKIGMTPILKLRLIPKWSDDAKEEKQARGDAEALVRLITEVNRKRLADPVRMEELVKKLLGTPEEKTYGQGELYKAGAEAVPYLVDASIKTTDSGERLAFRQTLERLGPDALAPMIAALESDSTMLKLDLLHILRTRYVRSQTQIIPHLWYVSASAKQPEEVRKKARSILAEFLDLSESRLPLAKVALTAEAEKYLNRRIAFGDPAAVVIWRWDGSRVVQGFPKEPTVSAARAEEYYGLRFAQLALTLDPTYRPAQVVHLSLAVERAVDRGGPSAPLSRTAPAVAELVANASPELINEMLNRAIKDKRTGVVLATVRTLGERAEIRGKQSSGSGDPGLVQALYYPDARVQIAAALSLLRIPGPPAPKTAARIVDILARALKPAAAYIPGRKVLVASADEDYRGKITEAVDQSGFKAIPVTNGRDAMRQIRASAEIDAILLDSTLPNPGLAHTLAQLRADADAARLPILLAAVPMTHVSRDAAKKSRALQARLDAVSEETRPYRALLKSIDKEEAAERKEAEATLAKEKRLSPEEKLLSLSKIEDKYAEQRKEAAANNPIQVRLLKDRPLIEREMNYEIKRYDYESQLREAALERFVSRYEMVRVVHVSLLTEGKSLEAALSGLKKDTSPPLTPAEIKDYSEQAMTALAGLAEGKPSGYDVTPVSATILDALSLGRMGPDGQLAGIRAVTTFIGDRPQRVLASAVTDEKRTADVRLAALRALTLNMQTQGRKLSEPDVMVLIELSKQVSLEPKLKTQLAHFIGSLRPSERKTGERLRDHPITPVPALPPPK